MPRLSGIYIPSGTDTILYTAPTNKKATITVNFVNGASDIAVIRAGFVSSGSSSMSNIDYIEYNTVLPPGATLERTGLTPYNGERVIVYSNINGVTATAWGYTE